VSASGKAATVRTGLLLSTQYRCIRGRNRVAPIASVTAIHCQLLYNGWQMLRAGAGLGARPCHHQADADLQKPVDSARGDVPLIHLCYRWRCGSRLTDWLCTSK